MTGLPTSVGATLTSSNARRMWRSAWRMRNSVRCLRIAGTGIVISQLQARGYFPTLLAPTVAPLPGTVVTLTQSPVVGVLYRTLDGTDPRPFGGSPSAAAA